ncbi:MAG TPA: hypothetical protein VK335_30740 [Bryobacteraceae bacterium]|nr:hypothetical protein [Bryobacteraceae bacterium]
MRRPILTPTAIGLSDVLYQEQKYEESAAVLNKLRSAKSQKIPLLRVTPVRLQPLGRR